MPNNELGTISVQQVSPSSEVIRRWLVVFGELYRQTITPALVGMWEMLLADLAPDVLDRACQRVAETVKFFPTPADVRGQIAQADARGFQLEAEDAWEWASRVADDCYFVDLGGLRGAPQIPPAIEFAVKACGGWGRLHTCSQDERVWCRKTFIERYTVLHETRAVQHLLTRGEARRILAELAAGPREPERKTLPAAAETATDSAEPTGEEVLAGFAALHEKLAVRPAVVDQAPSEEEWERRKREQKKGFKTWLAEHPEAEQPEQELST